DFIQRGFEHVGASELRSVEEDWTGRPVGAPLGSRYFYFAAAAASIVAGIVLLLAWQRSFAARTYPDNAKQHALTRICYIIAVTIAIAIGVAIVNDLVFARAGVPVALPLTAAVVIALILAARRGYVPFARAALPPVVAFASAYFMLGRDGVHDAAV